MRRPLAGRAGAAVMGALAVAALVSACTTGSGPGNGSASSAQPVTSSAATSAAPPVTSPAPPASTSAAPSSSSLPEQTVKVTALESDDHTYGVGMPIVLYFSPLPTDPAAFEKAATVTVDGRPAGGAWFWEQPDADEVSAHVVEAHYRPAKYWPADSTVTVELPIGGLSAGVTKTHRLVYWNKLTSLSFRIGDAHVSTVNGASKQMVVRDNGQVVKTFAISLGQSHTPTYTGTKLVMQKGEDVPGTNTPRPDGTVHMENTAHTYSLMVQWSVRITQSGEYIHAAPWNSQIGRTNTSDGCTNLTTADAQWFYDFARIGDVVTYSNTGGGPMSPYNGLGDWNVPWGVWEHGGLLSAA